MRLELTRKEIWNDNELFFLEEFFLLSKTGRDKDEDMAKGVDTASSRTKGVGGWWMVDSG